MSIVIIGGNERMERQYIDVCKTYGYKAKVFTKMKTGLKDKMGSPDLFICFTNTVSHKLVLSANVEAKKQNIRLEKIHSSSISALKNLLNTIDEVC